MRVKELALDGTKTPFPLLGHQIDARVRSVAVRPLIPQPHALRAVTQDARVPGQGGLHQALEGSAHAKQVGGMGAENGQGFVKVRHVVGSFQETVQA